MLHQTTHKISKTFIAPDAARQPPKISKSFIAPELLQPSNKKKNMYVHIHILPEPKLAVFGKDCFRKKRYIGVASLVIWGLVYK
jgi:hypothetical protein